MLFPEEILRRSREYRRNIPIVIRRSSLFLLVDISIMEPEPVPFLNLTNQYAVTYLSLKDLYTYELIILFIYGIMIIFSFFTNLIAIIVFFVGRRSRSELSLFLLNLSIFNIIMTVYCIPFTITSVIFQRWLYARELCNVLDGLKTFSVSGVLLTLITIAIDRYCAVKYPSTAKFCSAKKKNYVAISIIWLLSIALAVVSLPARSSPVSEQRLWVSSRTLLQGYVHSLNNLTETPESHLYLTQLEYRLVDTIQCVPNKIRRPVEVRRTISNFLQTYFVPLFILGFVYLRIAALLWQRTNETNYELWSPTRKNLFSPESIQFKKKLKQGIKMLVAVVILYAVLWLPMNVFQLCLNLLCYQRTDNQSFCNQPVLLQLLYIAAHFLSVSNTAINPIIYGFMNNCFRSDIRQLRRRLIHCQRGSPLYVQARFARQAPRELEARYRPIIGNAQLIHGPTPRATAQPTVKLSSFTFDPNKLPRTALTSYSKESDHGASGRLRHTT